MNILMNMISYLADHGEDLIGGWVHRQDNYSPPEKTHIKEKMAKMRKQKVKRKVTENAPK